jgi:hypothetical protein
MRYLVGFVFVLALVSAPLAVSAQAGEEGATPEPNLEEPAPSAEPAPEEPALQLKLDAAGVEVAPSPPRTAKGYTLEETELRVRRARIGLGVSIVSFCAGGALMTTGVVVAVKELRSGVPMFAAGVALAVGGFVGTIASGALVRRRKHDRNSLREAHRGKPHRVQWDLARSRLVF